MRCARVTPTAMPTSRCCAWTTKRRGSAASPAATAPRSAASRCRMTGAAWSSSPRSTTCSRALRRRQCRTSTWPSAFPRPKASHWNDLLPPLRRQGVRKAVCEPLARGLTNAIALCSMAGRVGEECLQDRREQWSPPPSLPLPSQEEGQHQQLAAEAAPTAFRKEEHTMSDLLWQKPGVAVDARIQAFLAGADVVLAREFFLHDISAIRVHAEGLRQTDRSEERRRGKGGVEQCNIRWAT